MPLVGIVQALYNIDIARNGNTAFFDLNREKLIERETTMK